MYAAAAAATTCSRGATAAGVMAEACNGVRNLLSWIWGTDLGNLQTLKRMERR